MNDQSPSPGAPLLVPASLFPELPPLGEDRLRVLVVGQSGIDLLPQVLRSLANLGLSPLSTYQHRHADGTSSLPLEFEPQGQEVAERIARNLSGLPDVRRVVYQESGGGGLFHHNKERPIAAAG